MSVKVDFGTYKTFIQENKKIKQNIDQHSISHGLRHSPVILVECDLVITGHLRGFHEVIHFSSARRTL